MTNYPDESSLRFNGFFFFNSRWDILHLFRGEHYWLFFTDDEYFLFWFSSQLNRRLRFYFSSRLNRRLHFYFSSRLNRRLHFYLSLSLSSCRGLGLSCASGGTSLTLFWFLLNSFMIPPLDYLSDYLLSNLDVNI